MHVVNAAAAAAADAVAAADSGGKDVSFESGAAGGAISDADRYRYGQCTGADLCTSAIGSECRASVGGSRRADLWRDLQAAEKQRGGVRLSH